jgi:hypothetical protein
MLSIHTGGIMAEIVVFDTLKVHPDGFDSVSIGMTTVLSRENHPFGTKFRPNVLITCSSESGCTTSYDTFDLREIDACLIDLGFNRDFISIYGPEADIHLHKIARIVGYRSEFNSDDSDMNTGRLIITRKPIKTEDK